MTPGMVNGQWRINRREEEREREREREIRLQHHRLAIEQPCPEIGSRGKFARMLFAYKVRATRVLRRSSEGRVYRTKHENSDVKSRMSLDKPRQISPPAG